MDGAAGPAGPAGAASTVPGPAGPTGATSTVPGPTGPTGSAGSNGWSPQFSVISDNERRVLQLTDWTGGTGTKPGTGDYVGATGLVASIAAAIDIRGSSGLTGFAGWSPSVAVVAHGDNLVLRIVTWVGGMGTPPTSGSYIGSSGLVADADDAVNIKGSIGPAGDTGWSPRIFLLSDGDRIVMYITDWIGGTGTQPQGQLYIGSANLYADAANAVDIRGPRGFAGPAGNTGWSPSFSLVSDGTRRVLQVTSWVGGTGTAPATSTYVGSTGLVSAIADAVDIRGPAGAGGDSGATVDATHGLPQADAECLGKLAVNRDDGRSWVCANTPAVFTHSTGIFNNISLSADVLIYHTLPHRQF